MGKLDKKLVCWLVFVVVVVFEGVVGRSVEEAEKLEEQTEFQVDETQTQFESHRNSRLFPLFPWNKPKSSNSNTACGLRDKSGTCQSSKYCKLKGGNNTMADCAGNNVCCQIRASCSTDAETCPIRESGVLIIHETTTQTYTRNYVFPRIKGACQLQLSLDLFSLAPPSLQGNCDQDSMTITGSPTANRFRICGENSGQILYLDYGTSDMITLIMNIKNPDTAEFVIRPTFIRCDSTKRVPAHCLQYFKDPSYQVKSFNFEGQQQISNLDYNVCIKSSTTSGEIRWSECSQANTNNFFVTGNPINRTNDNTGTKECTTDFVEIYGGGRHCGTRFVPVSSVAKPFLVNVHFDGSEIPPPLPNVDKIEYPSCLSPNPQMWTCAPQNATQTCQCGFGPGFTWSSDIELQNTGFCLEYSQI